MSKSQSNINKKNPILLVGELINEGANLSVTHKVNIKIYTPIILDKTVPYKTTALSRKCRSMQTER